MKHTCLLLIGFLGILTQLINAQNAPLTKAGSILNASSGSVSVAITVNDFENIGAFNLKLTYDPSVAIYSGSISNPVFTGMTVTNPGTGIITAEWTTQDNAVTLIDGSILFELEFVYISGSTFLFWDDDGTSCEYKNDMLIVLNDSPATIYYTSGYITNHAAPITNAPNIIDAETGTVNIPITVENFWDIGSFDLSFNYDPNVLTYTGNTPNPLLEDDMTVSSQSSTGGMEKITIDWSSVTPETLADGNTLVTINFNYQPTLFSGFNYSELTWNTNGVDCEFKDVDNNALFDLPYNNFYINGLIAEQTAPKTYLTILTDAIDGNTISIPIQVQDFQEISSVSLIFEFDPTVMSFVSGTPNSNFGGSMLISSPVDGEISLSYFGSAVSIDDMDNLAEIEFSYTSGTSTLSFRTNGYDCAYGDDLHNKLWDEPYEEYYFDGLIASQVAPKIKVDSTYAIQDNLVSIPVSVNNFNNINSYSLALDYDPNILTYVNSISTTEIEGIFTDETTNTGRVEINWTSNSQSSLDDSSTLAYFNFTYSGGKTPLLWYNNESSCEFTTGPANEILYDLPTENHYNDGVVEGSEYIWTGTVSTDWNTTANWSGNIIPDSNSIVSIPATPVPNFWPTFSGNFALGVLCKELHLDDGAEMIISGDMVINPGSSFINLGSGILNLGGAWKNTGIFVPKTGEVIFTDESLSTIPPAFLPAVETQNYILETEIASLIPITGGSAGPTGDDSHSEIAIGFTFSFCGTDYTQLRINTNGWISLDQTGEDAYSENNEQLFFTSGPTTTLAPWWDDLNADASSAIGYLTSGVAPNRILTVEWKDMLSYSSGSTSRINFQVKLHETTNMIEFCYGNIANGDHNMDESASIGIKSTTGGTSDFLEATTNSRNTVITTLTSENNWPSTNFIFIPPPTEVTFFKLTLGENAILNVETDVNITGE